MEFTVEYTEKAISELTRLKESDPKAYDKASKLIEELKIHPRKGTGHPEPLKGQPENRWSRRISKKHRLVYRIYDTAVVVLVISAYGHYDDK